MGFIALVAAIAVGAGSSQIAYLARGSLYVLKCDGSGAPVARQICVCSVRGDSLSWKHGQIEVEFSDEIRYVVQPVAGAKPRKIVQGEYVRYPSPAGNATIVVHDYGIGNLDRKDAYLIDAKGKKILLARNIDGRPLWSPRGDSVGIVILTSRGGMAELMHYPDIRNERGLGEVVNMQFTSYSPDGKWIALSDGPLKYRGSSIAEVATGRRVTIPPLKGLGQTDIVDWSPDSSKLLVCHYGQDDWEHWTKGAVSVFDIKTKRVSVIDRTPDIGEAAFCPDGRHVLWIDTRRKTLERVDSANPSSRRTLAKGVSAFSIRRVVGPPVRPGRHVQAKTSSHPPLTAERSQASR